MILKVLVGVGIVIAVLIGVAFWRGVLYMQGAVPKFDQSAITNPRPSLSRPITFPSDFTPEAQQEFNQQIAKTKAAIAADPTDISSWYDLAIDYRMVQDYAGAVEIWKYLSVKYPTDGISLHNLGEYYFHTVKDYPTAEGYYLRSLAVQPSLEQDYLDLADMYEYAYKQNTTAAVDILKEGASALGSPHGIDLVLRLGQYYADTHDVKDARATYQIALQAAQALHNQSLIASIQRTLAQLR